MGNCPLKFRTKQTTQDNPIAPGNHAKQIYYSLLRCDVFEYTHTKFHLNNSNHNNPSLTLTLTFQGIPAGSAERNLTVSLHDFPCHGAAGFSLRIGERLSVVSEYVTNVLLGLGERGGIGGAATCRPANLSFPF